jgi:hypothetical protein
MNETGQLVGERVAAIVAKRIDGYSQRGGVIAEEVRVYLETRAIRILHLNDTDELIIEEMRFAAQADASPPDGWALIDGFTGGQCSVLWRCINDRGYFDMLALGFNNLHPGLMIVAEGD